MALTDVGKVGLGLFAAGTVVFVIGFSVPYWVVYRHTKVRVGLWESCTRHDYCWSTMGNKFTTFGEDLPNWFRVTQALACLALITIGADCILRLLFICGKPIDYLVFSILCDCLASILAILAAVVFGTEMDKYYNVQLHFGFAFDVMGGLLIGIAGVCFLVEYCRRR
ncbi:uncharacterized protein LOC143280251 [Babylonia areolata]|uniref:uncharacterized protein LOC143280251 n=1 Tax=Babylonia areolata TaxID=304850 RepID=UPI003FD2AA7F